MTEYFEFDCGGKLLSGWNALARVRFELKIRGKNRPFLMSDRGLEKLGLVSKALRAMELGCEPVFFADIPADSSTAVVSNAYQSYVSGGCDCIIALGGGSVLDTAKGVVLTVTCGGQDISVLEGMDAFERRDKTLFVAIPTTAGTGSEATSVAVIKSPEKGCKLEYISPFLLPDISVIDPCLTLSLPPRITAATALDALTHAIEAYTCLMKNPLSDIYAKEAIDLIYANLPRALADGKDKRARWNLANGAYLAGAAFSNSMVGAVHSVGHALGAVCSVPHGEAMAILLPHVMRFNMPACGILYGELLSVTDPQSYFSAPEERRGELFTEDICAYLKRISDSCGLPLTLSATGKVERAQFKDIAEKAIADGSAIVNPLPLDTAAVTDILKKAY